MKKLLLLYRLLTTKESCPLTINLLDTPGYYGDTILGCHGVYDIIFNGIQDKLNQVYFSKNATDINNNYKKVCIAVKNSITIEYKN